MRLEKVGLRGRRFLIQYREILTEFGAVIPWLHGLEDLSFMTNGRFFADELRRRTEQGDDQIVPYQFVLDDAGGTFLGGVLSFGRSPEQFKDRRNQVIAERLAHDGHCFLSCLQVRPPWRSASVGTRMWQRAIRAVLRDRGPFWGVVSDHRRLRWYAALGSELHSPLDNKDGLWVISWRRGGLG